MNFENIAKFEKVTFEQYLKDVTKLRKLKDITDSDKENIFNEWMSIELPKRSTNGSAGYDFHCPTALELSPFDDSKLLPTGIRVKMDEGWVLMLFPRSGLGTKYQMGLDNTVGIIDSDYYNADNEGHIMAKLHSGEELHLNANDRFMQGIFLPFGVASNGNSDNSRSGGFGSTGN